MVSVIVGCEKSQAVCLELRSKGINAYSCDLLPCSGDHPEWHLQINILIAVRGGKLITQSGEEIFIERWHGGIFFPDCTYLTCSAEWAYKDPDYERYPGVGYHQKVKPGTLVGEARREARHAAIMFFLSLWNLDTINLGAEKITLISIENPVGIMSKWIKPTQTIQPYQFGDNASKRTCLWLKGFSKLIETEYCEPRMVCKCKATYKYKDADKGCPECGETSALAKPRWENQTDGGQNKLSPSDDRAELRSKTYPGIAKAMAEQWENILKDVY